jgi:hypothetical protein
MNQRGASTVGLLPAGRIKTDRWLELFTPAQLKSDCQQRILLLNNGQFQSP